MEIDSSFPGINFSNFLPIIMFSTMTVRLMFMAFKVPIQWPLNQIQNIFCRRIWLFQNRMLNIYNLNTRIHHMRRRRRDTFLAICCDLSFQFISSPPSILVLSQSLQIPVHRPTKRIIHNNCTSVPPRAPVISLSKTRLLLLVVKEDLNLFLLPLLYYIHKLDLGY